MKNRRFGSFDLRGEMAKNDKTGSFDPRGQMATAGRKAAFILFALSLMLQMTILPAEAYAEEAGSTAEAILSEAGSTA